MLRSQLYVNVRDYKRWLALLAAAAVWILWSFSYTSIAPQLAEMMGYAAGTGGTTVDEVSLHYVGLIIQRLPYHERNISLPIVISGLVLGSFFNDRLMKQSLMVGYSPLRVYVYGVARLFLTMALLPILYTFYQLWMQSRQFASFVDWGYLWYVLGLWYLCLMALLLPMVALICWNHSTILTTLIVLGTRLLIAVLLNWLMPEEWLPNWLTPEGWLTHRELWTQEYTPEMVVGAVVTSVVWIVASLVIGYIVFRRSDHTLAERAMEGEGI